MLPTAAQHAHVGDDYSEHDHVHHAYHPDSPCDCTTHANATTAAAASSHPAAFTSHTAALTINPQQQTIFPPSSSSSSYSATASSALELVMPVKAIPSGHSTLSTADHAHSVAHTHDHDHSHTMLMVADVDPTKAIVKSSECSLSYDFFKYNYYVLSICIRANFTLFVQIFFLCYTIQYVAVVLELSIAVHSIIIGVSFGGLELDQLGEIKVLMAALSLHQFFEGIALGSALSESNLSMRYVCLFGVSFSLSWCVGVVIGKLTTVLISAGYVPHI